MEAEGYAPSVEIIGDGKIHRFDVQGDKKGSENGWYLVHCDDHPNGEFGSWKTGEKFKWKGQVSRRLTEAERKAFERKLSEQKKKREEEQNEAARRAENIWQAASTTGRSNYIDRKGIRSFGARFSEDCLVIPIRTSDGKLSSLQFIDSDGTKRFLAGGRIEGCYTRISKAGSPLETFLICEGYATGASLHQATDLPVAIAFNAGNLSAVAQEIRRKYADAKIIICADNDAWTERPVKNPGVTYASRAAELVGAGVAIPEFKDLRPEERCTDFNDLAIREGLPRVAEIVESVIRSQQTPVLHEQAQVDDEKHNPVLAQSSSGRDHFEEWPFRPLGCGVDQNYYYLKAALNQVVHLAAAQHSKTQLLHLAPLSFWEMEFPGKQGASWDSAANALMRACETRGIFSPNLVRGRGTWHDDGRVVLHLGDRVLVNSETCKPRFVQSRFVYEESSRLELDPSDPLPVSEAIKLFEIMKLVPWDERQARLASGWIMCAHVGGALKWRPHIWVTGRKGSGKSWVMTHIIHAALGENSAFMVSESTEAGIRQSLRNDALPVLFDEAEGEDKRANDRIQRVLSLARQSSSETGAKIAKGTVSGQALTFQIRSCFALSSIKPSLHQEADRSRFCVVDVDKERFPDRFTDLQRSVAKTINPTFARRLFARAVRLANVIRSNAETFADAVAQTMSDRRAGDQYGALLAGNYALHSDREITLEAAKAWLETQHWTAEVKEEVQSMNDEQKCLEHLLASKIRIGMKEASVGMLVEIGIAGPLQWGLSDEILSLGIADIEARQALSLHGIRVEPEKREIEIARAHPELRKLFEHSPYENDWGSVLKRLPGATITNPKSFGSKANQSRAIRFAL